MQTTTTEAVTRHVRCDLCGADDGEPVYEHTDGCYSKCRRCGFVYADPIAGDTAADNEAFFTESLQRYVTKNYAADKQRHYRRILRKFARYRKTNCFLEIGSNVGGLLLQARRQGWKPVGVEPVDVCARYGRQHHNLEIITGTLEQADLDADRFDVVYGNDVFEHLPCPTLVFAEVGRILRPGGVLYLDTVNYESYTRGMMGHQWKMLNPSAHYSIYSPDTLRAFCEKADLKVLRLKTHGVRNRKKRERGLSLPRMFDEIGKLPYSIASRFTLKGDSLSVLAQKP